MTPAPSTENLQSPRVLILTPIKNAAAYLDGWVERIERLQWPREALSLGLHRKRQRRRDLGAPRRAGAEVTAAGAAGDAGQARLRLQGAGRPAALDAGAAAPAADGAGARPQPTVVPRLGRRGLGAVDRRRRNRLSHRHPPAAAGAATRHRPSALRETPGGPTFDLNGWREDGDEDAARLPRPRPGAARCGRRHDAAGPGRPSSRRADLPAFSLWRCQPAHPHPPSDVGPGRDRDRRLRRDGARHGRAVWGLPDLEIIHAKA